MKEKLKVEALAPEFDEKLARADALRQKSCYVALKQAFEIYSDLYAQPSAKKKVATRLAMTSLLLTVREKELGMANKTFMDRALQVIKENPFLNGFVPYAEIAGLLWVQGKGVMRDIDERFPWKETEEKQKKMENELREKAEADEFFSYMYATLKCFFSSPYEKRNELTELGSIFPDSLLLKYKKATCPEENEGLLKEILGLEPRR